MAWAKYLEVQDFWYKIPSQEVPPTPVIKHETGSFSSYHQELQPGSQVSGVEQEVETQHQYSYAEYGDQEYTRGEWRSEDHVSIFSLNTIRYTIPFICIDK